MISALCSPALAASGDNVIYAGAGASTRAASPYDSDKTPFSIGYLHTSTTSDTVFGFDISQEGTKLDSTWGQSGAIKQGTSLNLLVGGKVVGSAKARLDVAILVGGRLKTQSCADSYLGFRCYADAAPDNSYAINYGGVLAFSFHRVMLGARVTGESAQGLVGIRF